MGENLEIFERQAEDDDKKGISIYNDVLPKVMSRTNVYTMILLQVVYNVNVGFKQFLKLKKIFKVPSFMFFWFLMEFI